MHSSPLSIWHLQLSELFKNSLWRPQRALKCDIWVLNNNLFDGALNKPKFPSNALIIWQPGGTSWQDIHSFIQNSIFFSTECSRTEGQFISIVYIFVFQQSNSLTFLYFVGFTFEAQKAKNLEILNMQQ